MADYSSKFKIGNWVLTPDGRGRVSELKGAGTSWLMYVVTLGNGERMMYREPELKSVKMGGGLGQAPNAARRLAGSPLGPRLSGH